VKPRLLDLFCGAGGAAMGYHRAGFDVVGVDIKSQPNYPFEFIQGDAIGVRHQLTRDKWCVDRRDLDAIHASPPCQAHTSTSNRWRGNGGTADEHPDLIGPTRDLLLATGFPYVIENVVGAAPAMRTTLLLSGSMFGLGVHRPRLFESNVALLAPGPGTKGDGQIGVYGKRPDGRRLNSRTTQRAAASLEEARQAMDIDWMEWRELCEAIPPAYTELIGHQLLAHIQQEAVA
jgi:DNA (cytosine-5)-methyltransferase 1